MWNWLRAMFALGCKCALSVCSVVLLLAVDAITFAESFPGTASLQSRPDLGREWVAFLEREIARAAEGRGELWRHDTSSNVAYAASVEPMRQKLAGLLGICLSPVVCDQVEQIAWPGEGDLLGAGPGYQIRAVRWRVERDLWGEGLLLEPQSATTVAQVIAIPDAAHSPEQLVGLDPGVPAASQYARHLAQAGVRVLVPRIVDRSVEQRGKAAWRAYSRQRITNREFLYRPAFQLGRHLIGYEVNKIRTAACWLSNNHQQQVGVIGWGEGGLLALYAAALDPVFDACLVSGYFQAERQLWREPLDRNIFGLTRFFGDAEIASLVVPRCLVVETAPGPEGQVESPGAAAGQLVSPDPDGARHEFRRLAKMAAGLEPPAALHCVAAERPVGRMALEIFLKQFQAQLPRPKTDAMPDYRKDDWSSAERQQIQNRQIDRHNQWLLRESTFVREKFMSKLDTASLETYEASVAPYREHFRREMLGLIDSNRMVAPSAQTRKLRESPGWTTYELVLEVFPGTHSYGYLNVPHDVSAETPRPVVFCQHGGGGNPDVVTFGDHPAYHGFAGKLAERGFITYAPLSLYGRADAIVRRANVIGKTQYSVIAAQYLQVIRWLQSLPSVASDRIGLYGLSWGGKTAMRLPILVPDFALTICSGDFNEWTWKTASTRDEVSYAFQPEPYIFEWNLGNTYGYAEMAALIAPRPFLVERGHFDPVGTDPWIGLEFAKVRHHYVAQLKLPDRCAIDWFVGGHEIHGTRAFDFLHRHLNWPSR